MSESLPDGITRELLLDAISKFDAGVKHEFADSTGYDIIHDGKSYPPKAIVGIAAKTLKGVTFVPDDFSGGVASKCFRILEENGFKIVSKKNSKMINTNETGTPLFTEKTFSILEGLAATPTKAFYEQHKNEIAADIQNPLRGMFKLVQQRMPESILCTLETEKRILSNVLKNDYGKGATYDYIWGGFYPKGQKRTHSAQLFLSLNKNNLAAGFYVGTNGEDVQKRFKENCKNPEALSLATQLDDQFRDSKIAYGSKKPKLPRESDSYTYLASFVEWFQRVDDVGVGFRIFFSKEEVLKLSSAELADKVSELFIKFFPLFFIALEEDPFPAIKAFQKGTSIEKKCIPKDGSKELFKQYLKAKFPQDNRGTVTSYIGALDFLSRALQRVPNGFEDCTDIWRVSSTERLRELQNCVREQSRLGDASVWNISDLPDSYLKKGWCHAAIPHYIDFLNKGTMTEETQFWTWAAGEGGKHWDEFYNQGIVAIGWDEIGDLRQFKTKDEIRHKILGVNSDTVPEDASSKKNDVLACWEFANEIKIGDIIFSKHGKSKIIGYGVVQGGYEFDDSREQYKQIRKVKWLSKGEWVLPNGNEMAVKTLTNITLFTDFVSLLSNLVGLQVEGGSANVLPNNPAYSVAECAKESGFSVKDIEQWVRAINRKGQAIFYGAPGTGKTFIADKLARHLIGNGNGFEDLIQFHPAYSYEDFIEGIRPATKGGQLSYSPAAGRFLDFCKKAEERDGVCVLIIDEINRANLSRVFGELMYLLEYRDQEMVLAGGTKFRIPNNVRIIGTMNTADRSIALVDHALRRRFSFIPLSPRYEVIESFHAGSDFDPSELIKILRTVNALINDKHYHIGISFFLRKDLKGEIADIWNLEIEPYLEEFFFDQQEKVEQFRWSKIESKVLGA